MQKVSEPVEDLLVPEPLGRLEMDNRELSSLDEIIAEVESVTEEDVRDVGNALFDRDHLSSVVFAPTNSN